MLTDRVGMRPFFTTHGKDWLLVTPMANYFILLTDAEIEELGQMMDEASVLIEVGQILQTSAKKTAHRDDTL